LGSKFGDFKKKIQNMLTLGHFFKKIICMGPTPFGGGWGGGGSFNCENLPQKNVVMVFARKRLGVKRMFASM
jgi:hypothetical protein